MSTFVNNHMLNALYIHTYMHILREYTYVPHGSGIVYITIAQGMHRGRCECPGRAPAVTQKLLPGNLPGTSKSMDSVRDLLKKRSAPKVPLKDPKMTPKGTPKGDTQRMPKGYPRDPPRDLQETKMEPQGSKRDPQSSPYT